MAKQTFVADAILTAAQMNALQGNDFNQTVSTKTASYTLVAADAGTKVVMNSASATTITVNTSLFAAGDTLTILNIAAGVCTVTAGTATVSTTGTLALVQNAGGGLYFTSAGVSVFQSNGVTATSAGLVQVVPTSVAVTGASSSGSVDTNGNVTFALATGIILNGIFSATFDYYKMLLSVTASAGSSDDNFEYRYTTSGTANGDSTYSSHRLDLSGTTVTGSSQLTQTQAFIGAGISSTDGNTVFAELEFFQPFASKVTRCTSVCYAINNSSTQKSSRVNSLFDNTTSFDGFAWRLAGLTGPTFTGDISVYGYRK